MSGAFMNTAVNALKLFIQSLPLGCKFSIISFGSSYEVHKQCSSNSKDGVFTYSDQVMTDTKNFLDTFSANFGGTELYAPLKDAQKLLEKAKHGRIFILTDGQVWNRDQTIQIARQSTDNIRIHTFGIGSGCDASLVEGLAKEGRGYCSLVRDLGEGNLAGNVVSALNRALYPSLQ